MLLPLFLRERPGEKRLPWQAGQPSKEALAMKVESWGEILFTLKNVFILRTSFALAVMGFVFCICIGFMDALLPIYTIQELGLTNDTYSNVLASVSTGGAFLAMAVAGWLVERIGKVRILSIYLALMVAIPIAVALTRDYWMISGFGVWLIVGYMTLYTFIMVAYLATAMNLCWKRVAATQFTLYMALGNMGRAVGSSLLGPVREQFDWPGTFVVFAVFMALALVTVQAFQLLAHQRSLDRLEADHLAKLPRDFGGPLVPR